MDKTKNRFYKNKRFKIGTAIFAASMLTTTAIVLPTVFYGTAENLLYIDTFGKIQRAADAEAPAKVENHYMGEYNPDDSYNKGDVVSYSKIVFEDDRLIDEVSTVSSKSLYVFNDAWTGGDFAKAPVSPFDPFTDNLTTINLPFDQLLPPTTPVDSFMGQSTLLSGMGRASVTGKFNGSGAAYDPWNRPGYAYVNNDYETSTYQVQLTGLNDFFTYTKTTDSQLQFDNQTDGTKRTESYTAPYTYNGVPIMGDSQKMRDTVRNYLQYNGMTAYQFTNEGEITNEWTSNINGYTYTTYADMQSGWPDSLYPGWPSATNSQMHEWFPTFTKLSDGPSDMTFNLNDDELGMYIYSKASAYTMADRAACNSMAGNLPYAAYHGYYQGTAEPVIYTGEPDWDKNNEKWGYSYLGPHTAELQRIRTKDGTISRNVDSHQLVGAYIYSNSRQWPENSDIMNTHAEDIYDAAGDLDKPFVNANGSSYNAVLGEENNARSFSYYNGVFSLNKPKSQVGEGQKQQIRWYTPFASTDLQVSIKQDKVNEVADKYLATDAMNTGTIASFINFDMFNAIPSTYYGGNVSICADNSTGTIWLKFRTGPTVQVVNGSLFKEPQVASTVYNKPAWLGGQVWTYYYKDGEIGGTGSAMWTLDNTKNPITQIDMAEPLEYAIGITGFPEVKPTFIIDTTNPDGEEFVPGLADVLDGSKKYGPFRLTNAAFTKVTPFEYIKAEEEKPDNERYSELLELIFENLVENKTPSGGMTKPDGTPFIELSDLVRTSEPVAFNFVDPNHPEWGGRLQFAVTLNKYFDKEGQYVAGSGGFEPVRVVFGGFKAVPGPTKITGNYNLNSIIPGGAVTFNKESLPASNGVNYPSDYVSPTLASGDKTVYDWLTDLVTRWSNPDPFKGPNKDQNNKNFGLSSYMIQNLPPPFEDPTNPGKMKTAFTLNKDSVSFNNFTGILRITPQFNRYYATDGSLIDGVSTTLGTITISGFQTVNGSTYIPNVVNAITTYLQPSAIVTRINGEDQTTPGATPDYAQYVGQELYKIVWNEAINLPTKNYDLPPYTEAAISAEQLQEIRKVVDIRVKPDDRKWVNNMDGSLTFAVAFKKMFDKDGIPQDIASDKLWPANWDTGGEDNDNVFIVTVYGYDNSPGPTGILQVDGKNRNITINQSNYQPTEFIKNDATAGYPLLKSLIAGNLVNLPKTFTTDDIVLDVDKFNDETGGSWEPDPKPLKADNKNGRITVAVYLKVYYDETAKLCNYAEDNAGEPYHQEGWTFTIDGFMKTSAKGATDLAVTDSTFKGANKQTIDLADPNNADFLKQYPDLNNLKNLLPYQSASTTDVMKLVNIMNKSDTKKTDPYLLLTNVPANIKPYNIFVEPSNITADNKTGTLSFDVNLRQWFTNEKGDITYHPTLEDQSNGNTVYKTPNRITITGMKSVANATIINPTGDNIDSNTGTITLTKDCTSAKIIKGVLKGQYLSDTTLTDEQRQAKIKALENFDPTTEQSTILSDIGMKTYLYVALIKSNGSPYTLTKGSMVEQQGTDDDPAYIVKNANALDEFITWKNNPFNDLEKGTLTLSPMLNIWFGGDDVDVFNQYQSFGAGVNGKPIVAKDADGVTIEQPTVTQVILDGFIKAENSLEIGSGSVYDGTVNAVWNGLDINNMTATDFVKNGITTADGHMDFKQVLQDKKYLSVTPGVVAVYNEVKTPTGTELEVDSTITGEALTDLSNLVDFSNNNFYKVNMLNGTIEITTKTLKYFDANKQLQTGKVTIVLTGFLPSTSAYESTYIIIITTIIALIVILSIILARILWVRYSKSRDEYKNN